MCLIRTFYCRAAQTPIPIVCAAFGADWGLPADRLFAAYPDLLAAVAPDLVSICAYAPERVAMALAALAAGARGLWLEKAVATSLASARRAPRRGRGRRRQRGRQPSRGRRIRTIAPSAG